MGFLGKLGGAMAAPFKGTAKAIGAVNKGVLGAGKAMTGHGGSASPASPTTSPSVSGAPSVSSGGAFSRMKSMTSKRSVSGRR